MMADRAGSTPRRRPLWVATALLPVVISAGCGFGTTPPAPAASADSSVPAEMSPAVPETDPPATTDGSPGPTATTPNRVTPLPLDGSGGGPSAGGPSAGGPSTGGQANVVPSAAATGSLSRAYAQFGALANRSGIAIFPTSGSARQLQTAGSLRTGVAWSSIKVPLAMAALAADRSQTTRARAAAAIQRSDNAAASALWARLGSGTAAASKTAAMLRRGGDSATVVQSRQVRPPYSPFGQTVWSVASSARFGSALPCLREAGEVLPMMSAVVPDQRWGLGRIPGAAFKGGWGPVGRGYLVRQVGVIPTGQGRYVGVAVIVQAGSFAQGTADLDRIARWLQPRLRGMTGGQCPAGR